MEGDIKLDNTEQLKEKLQKAQEAAKEAKHELENFKIKKEIEETKQEIKNIKKETQKPQPTITQQTGTSKKPAEEKITKRLAALEVHKAENKLRLAAVTTAVLSPIIGIAPSKIGFTIGILTMAASGIVIFFQTTKLKYLETKYQIKPAKIPTIKLQQ